MCPPKENLVPEKITKNLSIKRLFGESPAQRAAITIGQDELAALMQEGSDSAVVSATACLMQYIKIEIRNFDHIVSLLTDNLSAKHPGQATIKILDSLLSLPALSDENKSQLQCKLIDWLATWLEETEKEPLNDDLEEIKRRFTICAKLAPILFCHIKPDPDQPAHPTTKHSSINQIVAILLKKIPNEENEENKFWKNTNSLFFQEKFGAVFRLLSCLVQYNLANNSLNEIITILCKYCTTVLKIKKRNRLLLDTNIEILFAAIFKNQNQLLSEESKTKIKKLSIDMIACLPGTDNKLSLIIESYIQQVLIIFFAILPALSDDESRPMYDFMIKLLEKTNSDKSLQEDSAPSFNEIITRNIVTAQCLPDHIIKLFDFMINILKNPGLRENVCNNVVKNLAQFSQYDGLTSEKTFNIFRILLNKLNTSHNTSVYNALISFSSHPTLPIDQAVKAVNDKIQHLENPGLAQTLYNKIMSVLLNIAQQTKLSNNTFEQYVVVLLQRYIENFIERDCVSTEILENIARLIEIKRFPENQIENALKLACFMISQKSEHSESEYNASANTLSKLADSYPNKIQPLLTEYFQSNDYKLYLKIKFWRYLIQKTSANLANDWDSQISPILIDDIMQDALKKEGSSFYLTIISFSKQLRSSLQTNGFLENQYGDILNDLKKINMLPTEEQLLQNMCYAARLLQNLSALLPLLKDDKKSAHIDELVKELMALIKISMKGAKESSADSNCSLFQNETKKLIETLATLILTTPPSDDVYVETNTLLMDILDRNQWKNENGCIKQECVDTIFKAVLELYCSSVGTARFKKLHDNMKKCLDPKQTPDTWFLKTLLDCHEMIESDKAIIASGTSGSSQANSSFFLEKNRKTQTAETPGSPPTVTRNIK